MISKNKLLMNNITFKHALKLINHEASYSTKPQEIKHPRRIFSGIQPTGMIHIGNYLGAIEQWVHYQNNEETDKNLFCIVDMHAMTNLQNPNELRNNILTMAATMLACGIDPEKSIIFQQSTVPMHAELYWILGCITTLPKLSLFPQFKEKSEKLKIVPVGLLTYPVLQSADILLYKATDVPVGEDQLAHLHLTQHIVDSFNKKFGKTFPIPQPLINPDSGRIKCLREPTKKMSKSSEYKRSCIILTDPPEVIKENIKKAVTDFTSQVTYEPADRPGVSNLVNIHSLLTDESPETICEQVKDLNTGQYKLLVADVIIEKLKPIREEFFRLMNDPDYLINVLQEGSLKASSLSGPCWEEVKQKVGFTGGILSSKNKEQHVKRNVV